MTKPKTRSTRRKPAAQKASAAVNSTNANNASDVDDNKSDTPDVCPKCESDPSSSRNDDGSKREEWVLCESCTRWYHWRCVSSLPSTQGHELSQIDKWYCESCIAETPSFTVTFKGPARKSGRSTNKLDYANLNNGVESNPKRWMSHLETKTFKPSSFRHMKGKEVNLSWLTEDENAMTEPIIIDEPDGLEMKMPAPSFTVSDVAKTVGLKEKVEVLDVASQREDKGWTLAKWAEYYNSPPAEREKIRNVISLEISETKLAEKVVPPLLVRQIDWVENVWPSNKRKGATNYPKVQLYCLMSVAQCWTDWHVDFAGSSVYYHILKGSKTFYFIRPSPANLVAYEKWSGSDIYQSSVWLGDWVDEIVKVELTEGNTMIIPTGWIHAVYTPTDSLVFGGNFLHSWNIATQIRVREMEIITKVPKKFRFPFFRRLCWYVAEKSIKDLKAKEDVPMRVLNGLDSLATFLISEARIMERTSSTETARKDCREQLPPAIKDPSAVARELRWRVRLAAGGDSGDELESPFSRTSSVSGKRSSTTPVIGNKRKRGVAEEDGRKARFKGFTPRPWDESDLRPIEKDNRVRVAIPRRPGKDDGLQWFEEAASPDGGIKAERVSDADEVIKIRRTTEPDGTVSLLEREMVRRVYEAWTFPREVEGSMDEVVEVVATPDVPSVVTVSKQEVDSAAEPDVPLIDVPAPTDDSELISVEPTGADDQPPTDAEPFSTLTRDAIQIDAVPSDNPSTLEERSAMHVAPLDEMVVDSIDQPQSSGDTNTT